MGIESIACKTSIDAIVVTNRAHNHFFYSGSGSS